MNYYSNYEADAVIREDDNGERYIKRIGNLNEVHVTKDSKEAYGIPSYGVFNELELRDRSGNWKMDKTII